MAEPSFRTLDENRESALAAAILPPGSCRLMLCTGTGCVAGGALKLKTSLEQEIARQALQGRVSIVATGCNGFCGQGPLMVVAPDSTFYGWLKPDDVPRLVAWVSERFRAALYEDAFSPFCLIAGNNADADAIQAALKGKPHGPAH